MSGRHPLRASTGQPLGSRSARVLSGTGICRLRAAGIGSLLAFCSAGIGGLLGLGRTRIGSLGRRRDRRCSDQAPNCGDRPRIYSDFFSADILLCCGTSTWLQNRVVTVTSQSGMARVRAASTILSRPVRMKAPTPSSAAPMSGFPIRESCASRSRRAATACRDP